MIISMYSGKGGVGKSFLTAQLIHNGFEAIDLDPFGDIFDRYEDKSIYLNEDEEIPDLSSIKSDLVLDFKGGKDKRIHNALDQSDLLIIPVIPSRETVSTTIKTIDYIDHDIPKLFVFNIVGKKSNLEQTIEVLNDMIKDFKYSIVRYSEAYLTSVNNSQGIIQMSKEKGIRGGAYTTHAREIQQFLNKVEEFRV